MKKYSVLLAMISLMFASLACQAVMGGGDSLPPQLPPNDGGLPTAPPAATSDSGSDFQIPTIPPVATDDSGNITIGGETDFPITDDATNMINMGNELVTFQTKLSLNEAMQFYRDQFDKLDYSERGADTFTSDALFTMVFDGHKSGKAITVQGVDMNGSTSITITLTDN